jgi:hypothetical protein
MCLKTADCYKITYCGLNLHKLLQVCKQVVTNLFTSCRQDVFALFVPSCCKSLEQAVNNLYKLDGIIRLVTRLFWQVWYSLHDITRMLQGWRHKRVTILLYQDYQTCWNNLVTSLTISTSLLQVVNLGQTVRIRQLVDGLLSDLLQDVRFLRV